MIYACKSVKDIPFKHQGVSSLRVINKDGCGIYCIFIYVGEKHRDYTDSISDRRLTVRPIYLSVLFGVISLSTATFK